jgi:hypothetical protein
MDDSAKNKLHFQMFSKGGQRYGKTAELFFGSDHSDHSDVNEFFAHLHYVLGSDNSFVIETDYDTLMGFLTLETRKYIVDNYNNLRIIHVINQQIPPFGAQPALFGAFGAGFGAFTQTNQPSDSYILCGNSKPMSIKRVELSTYDLSYGKYVNLTSLTPEQMRDYDMSFDYSDYFDSKPKRARVETEIPQRETSPSQEKKLAEWFAQHDDKLTVSDLGVILTENKSERHSNNCSQRRNKRNYHNSK